MTVSFALRSIQSSVTRTKTTWPFSTASRAVLISAMSAPSQRMPQGRPIFIYHKYMIYVHVYFGDSNVFSDPFYRTF